MKAPEVARYILDDAPYGAYMWEQPDGDWVKYEDFQKLKAELAESNALLLRGRDEWNKWTMGGDFSRDYDAWLAKYDSQQSS